MMAPATAAIVIASVAVVIAIGVVPWAWVWLLLRGRKALLAAVDERVDMANRTVAMALEQLNISRENFDAALQNAMKMRERANAHFMTADFDAYRADRRLTELERYTFTTLDHQVATGSKPLILRGGLYAQQLSVMDAMPELLEGFLAALGAHLTYRQDDGLDGTTFYVRWPAGKPAPRDVLGDATRAAAADDNSARGTPTPGAAELRAVLEAWRDGGLGALYVAPLIIVRTKACLSAGFLQPGFEGFSKEQKENAVNGTGPNLMNELNVAVFLEVKQ